ncbi:MAG: helicase HerA-like domain-containing protein [Saprospiraceae bacterium]
MTQDYDTEVLLTEMGIGEAFVSALNEKGIPTPLVHTLLRAPQSRMDVLTESEIDGIVRHSVLVQKYNQDMGREGSTLLRSSQTLKARTVEHAEEIRRPVGEVVEKEKKSWRDFLDIPNL